MKILYIYNTLNKPISTAKSCKLGNLNKYAFISNPFINKYKVKKAAEVLFNIKVKKVAVINSIGKAKNFKGKCGKRIDKKKFYISVYNK